jgi:hypothetical protein
MRKEHPNDAADASVPHSEEVLDEHSCFVILASAVKLGVFSDSILRIEKRQSAGEGLGFGVRVRR